MTTESVVPETLHAWAICLRASEEARRQGDRRTGTDHILLALLEDPSVEAVLGVSLQQARQALESAPTLPHCRCAPCRRSRGSETSRKKIASAWRPQQRRCLRKRPSPAVGGSRSRPGRCWPRSSLSNHQILRRCCWALST